MQHLKSLNAEQRRAVEYGIDGAGPPACGPLLVIAGAGSGKTTTLAARVAHLIIHGADPSRILLLTFSRRAAAEMARRVERIVAEGLGPAHPHARRPVVWAGTFHAVGARLLRLFAPSIGLSPSFTVHDREDSADLLNLVRHDLGLADKATRFPLKATCLAVYSHAINAGLALPDVLARHFPWVAAHAADLARLFDAYVAAKQVQSVLDYDDLLLYWAEMMQVPEIAHEVSGLFDHVLVDEYQDTNPLQARILAGLKPDGSGLTVVGDDAQAIYGFRAATVRNILDFPARFSPPAALVTLEQNYRSTGAILEASNAVIGLAAERFTKNLRTDREAGSPPRLVTVSDDVGEAQYVAERVLANRETGAALKDQAVLFRTSHHSGMLEVELARRNIPFVKFGGLKFLEAAHVKDLLAVLRFASNPRDRVMGFRVLQMLPGIGPAIAARAFDRMATSGPPFAPLAIFPVPAAAREAWAPFVALLEGLNETRESWPAEIESVRAWIGPLLEARYDDAHIRAGDLDQLARIAAQYASRERFLTELTLDPPDATSDEAGAPLLDEDYLILSTIHSAKGQEWRHVFVLRAVDGCIPSDMSTGRSEEIEEERRLLYVAMTRARDELDLILPQRFFVQGQSRGGDKHVLAQRTRFIPGRIADRFESIGWPAVRTRAGAPRLGGGQPVVDLKARVGGMWRAPR